MTNSKETQESREDDCEEDQQNLGTRDKEKSSKEERKDETTQRACKEGGTRAKGDGTVVAQGTPTVRDQLATFCKLTHVIVVITTVTPATVRMAPVLVSPESVAQQRL